MKTNQTAFENTVEQLADKSGQNTELVSVYIPAEGSLATMIRRLQNESAQAENIKSKQTRKNVTSAVDAIIRELQTYSSIPENGLAVFAGVIDSELLITVVDDPPQKIQSQLYHCDSTFYVNILKELIITDPEYIGITIDRGNASIGTIQGSTVITHDTITTPVPGKQKKGGQSQQRFNRLRLEAIQDHYERVGKKVNSRFVEHRHKIKGVLVGGPEMSRKEFMTGDHLHHELQDKICFDTSVTSVSSGMEELADKASKILAEQELKDKREYCETFFSSIIKSEATYGFDSVEKATEYGAVDTLLVSESMSSSNESLNRLISSVEEYGGDIIQIPNSFEKGRQLEQGFGGIGAILRYPLETN